MTSDEALDALRQKLGEGCTLPDEEHDFLMGRYGACTSCHAERE